MCERSPERKQVPCHYFLKAGCAPIWWACKLISEIQDPWGSNGGWLIVAERHSGSVWAHLLGPLRCYLVGSQDLESEEKWGRSVLLQLLKAFHDRQWHGSKVSYWCISSVQHEVRDIQINNTWNFRQVTQSQEFCYESWLLCSFDWTPSPFCSMLKPLGQIKFWAGLFSRCALIQVLESKNCEFHPPAWLL